MQSDFPIGVDADPDGLVQSPDHLQSIQAESNKVASRIWNRQTTEMHAIQLAM